MSSNQHRRKARSKKRKSEDLASRLVKFGAAVIDLCGNGATDVVPPHVRNQLVRAATAPGAHYAEARSAQSNDAFIHKTSLAAQEANEALYWLKLVDESAGCSEPLDRIIAEGEELAAILFRSHQTARNNRDESDGRMNG